MYNHNVTERGAEQQRVLEETLLQMMQRVSYESISVRSLCEKAGVSRVQFYKLFNGKDDVLNALIDQTFFDFESFHSPGSLLAPDASIQNLFEYWHQQEQLTDAIWTNQKSGLLVERCIAHILQEDIDARTLLGIDDADKGYGLLLFFMGGLMSLIIDWHLSGYKKTAAEMAEIFHSIIYSPIIRMRPGDNA